MFSRISFVFCRLISIKKKLESQYAATFQDEGDLKLIRKKKKKKTNPATRLTHLMSLCFIIRLSSGKVQIGFFKKMCKEHVNSLSLSHNYIILMSTNIAIFVSASFAHFFSLFEINTFNSFLKIIWVSDKLALFYLLI